MEDIGEKGNDSWLLQLDSDEQFSEGLLQFINDREYCKEDGYDAYAVSTLNHYPILKKYQYFSKEEQKFIHIDSTEDNKEWVLEHHPDYHVRLVLFKDSNVNCFKNDLHAQIQGYNNMRKLDSYKYIFHSKDHNRWFESGRYYTNIELMKQGKKPIDMVMRGRKVF